MDHKLTPIVATDVSDLLDSHSADVHNLVELLGSPLHITFPDALRDTAKQFRNTLNNAGMQDGKIHFAAKANKANAFMAASAAANICVDASSAQELTAALSAGVPGQNIGVSGPAKPPTLIALAIQHGAYIAINDPTELDSIIELATHLPTSSPVHVYLRISTSDDSRFGMTDNDINQTLSRLVDMQNMIQLDGFSFHVSGYDSKSRVDMIEIACKSIERAFSYGLKPTHINIGGGLQVTYANESEWSLQNATEREFAGGITPQFVYPYTGTPSGHAQLKEIVDAAMPSIDKTVNTVGHPIVIDLEPGRSLLDQAGVTVFRVRGVKTIGKHWLVMVDGNSRSLAEFWRNSEFFIDPILIAKSPQDAKDNEPFAAAIASNTCLESDYLARRFIPFARRPQTGDLLVYVNTAGYQMDSKESEFHRLPTPTKVAALKRADGWHFVNDSIVSVADIVTGEIEE